MLKLERCGHSVELGTPTGIYDLRRDELKVGDQVELFGSANREYCVVSEFSFGLLKGERFGIMGVAWVEFMKGVSSSGYSIVKVKDYSELKVGDYVDSHTVVEVNDYQEVTIADIEKKFGCKVKIIKEKV